MRNRTVLRLIQLADKAFSYSLTVASGTRHMERVDWFADVLFENEVTTSIVRAARGAPAVRGGLRAFLLSLWEDSVGQWEEWFRTTEERDAVMLQIAEAVLAHTSTSPTTNGLRVPKALGDNLLASLELDGYRYQGGRLMRQEANTFDVQEVIGLLEGLYRLVGLGDARLFANSLLKIDEHYELQNWGDCIKHSRDLLETSLVEALRAYARVKGEQVKPTTLGQAFAIRDKLEQLGFLDTQEKEFSKALYSLLSQQGGHANLSQKENALICRQYALSAVHFVLLRYEQLSKGA